jgi:hypothetical protein
VQRVAAVADLAHEVRCDELVEARPQCVGEVGGEARTGMLAEHAEQVCRRCAQRAVRTGEHGADRAVVPVDRQHVQRVVAGQLAHEIGDPPARTDREPCGRDAQRER